ncbi:LacI family transcriptional regulator [Vallitalea longa]|uniref:LacI family transcriptional regulator n=1 Tax=Vallitalea longa TaxID=2936439 RepID=A0A9W6DFB6_9FIRM|nr:substrate-binding domain-containing protein [Vallitalea longa]GKX29312.1 LacI family transcriptional regulator [Vallitalea longa]
MILFSDEHYTQENCTDKYRIGVVLKAMDSEYCLSLKSGVEKAADELDVDVLVVNPLTEKDVRQQNILIEDTLNSNVDAIVIVPCDSYNTEEYMELAEEKNIPVFSMDTDIYGKDEIYVGSDNIEIGEIAGRYMDKLLNGKGLVAVLTGTLLQSPHVERLEGFKDYLECNTNINIVYEEEAYCSFFDSSQKTKEILDEYGNIDGIFCTNATMALGVIDRLEFLKPNKSVRIIGVDTQTDTIRKIIDDKISAMVSQDGYDIAYETMQTVVKYLNGEDIEGNLYIENELINKEKAEKYLITNK